MLLVLLQVALGCSFCSTTKRKKQRWCLGTGFHTTATDDRRRNSEHIPLCANFAFTSAALAAAAMSAAAFAAASSPAVAARVRYSGQPERRLLHQSTVRYLIFYRSLTLTALSTRLIILCCRHSHELFLSSICRSRCLLDDEAFLFLYCSLLQRRWLPLVLTFVCFLAADGEGGKVCPSNHPRFSTHAKPKPRTKTRSHAVPLVLAHVKYPRPLHVFDF